MTQPEQEDAIVPDQNGPLKQKKKLLNGPHFAFTYPNGSAYTGGFKDGKMHGYGTYHYLPSGDVYEGEWKADMKHGQGRYIFAEGDSYTGSWYMGKKQGKGKFCFSSGDEYYGGWKADLMNGFGVFKLERNGDQYEGFWENGLREGLGILRSGSGNLYDGQWSGGKEDGFGVLEDVGGSLYCGSWKAGLKDGHGVETENGITYFVEYLGGYLISKQAYDADSPVEDEEFQGILMKLQDWQPPPPLHLQPSGIEELLDVQATDELKRRLESWRTAYLALYEHICSQNNVSNSSAVPIPEEEIVLDMKKRSEQLSGRIQLLEATLGERMLELRRVQEQVREKDATIQDLKLQLTHIRGERRKTVKPNGFALGLNGNPEASADGTCTCGAVPLLLELQKQIISLTKVNNTQQQKIAVLSSENDRLSSQVGSLEDELREREPKAAVRSVGEPDGTVDINEAGNTGNQKSLKHDLRQTNEHNAELLLRISRLERELSESQVEVEKLRLTGSRIPDKPASSPTLPSEQRKSDDEKPQTPLPERAPLPEWNEDVTRKEVNSEVTINDSLLDKEKRIAFLQGENAELHRLLEEYKFNADEGESAEKKRKRKHSNHSDAGKTQKNEEELQKADADLKKSKKKLKKVLDERNALALDLYNSQCSLARLNRLPQQLHGRVAIAVAVVEPSGSDVDSDDGQEPFACISDADPSQVLVPSLSKSFQFDCCFPNTSGAEHIFLELKSSLTLTAQGFQSAFVGLWGGLPGSRNVLSDLLPFLIEGLRTECALHEQQSREEYRVAYRVAAVEVGASGMRDSFSRRKLEKVVHDDHGYVQPSDVTFADCGAERILELLRGPLESRSTNNALSHLWMQIQVTVTHKVRQTSRCGRLTLFDLCDIGETDDGVGFDAASIRYVKRSMRQIDDLLHGLQTNAPTLPYGASPETSLLRDLLGGNSLTTILGTVSTDAAHQERTLAQLSTLESLERVRNGPLLQDFTGSDSLRWRELIDAISSADQATPSQFVVEDSVL